MIIGSIVSLQKDCNAIYVCDIVSVARILDMHNSSNEDKLVGKIIFSAGAFYAIAYNLFKKSINRHHSKWKYPVNL